MTLTIRHVEERDAAAVHAILTSRHVVEGTMRLEFMPLESTISRIRPETGKYKLVALDDEAVVGFAELFTCPDIARHAHAAEINMIAVHADHQANGVARALMQAMTELADRWLGIHRLGLIVWSNNARAIATYEQFGFRIEGTMRDYVVVDGKWIDAHVMGRIKTVSPTARKARIHAPVTPRSTRLSRAKAISVGPTQSREGRRPNNQ